MARYTENQIFRISERTFNDIDSWIRAAELSGRNIDKGMNILTMLMARTNQAFAQDMSRGPLDPRQQNPGAAWKLPVRRISGRYYKGWKVRRLAPGTWILYNDTREAYFIEYGINHAGQGAAAGARGGREYHKGSRRVRRPVRKLTLIKTLRALDRTHAGDRVWEVIWAPFRPGRSASRRGSNVISDGVQAVQGMRFI